MTPRGRPGAAGMLTSRRFEVLGELGRGGLGVVYEAIDRETLAHVALKTLLSPSPELLYGLKNEFRRLTDLRHPNLVQIGGLHYESGSCFLSMELIRGCDFSDYVRGHEATDARPIGASDETLSMIEVGLPESLSDNDGSADVLASDRPDSFDDRTQVFPQLAERAAPSYDEARLRSALRQLAEAVRALHAVGLVHRDLKPSNVMVERGGRVVVLDFGLTETLQGLTPRGKNTGIRGTAAFMAPEQAGEDSADEALDWYAVGVMLFEALTGRLPFEGSSAQMVAKKRTCDAPRPSDYVRDLPLDLEQLCVALLAREPTQRLSGQQVLEHLSGRRASQTPRTQERRFVGREQELATLAAALREVRAGRFCGLLVEGEPGVGKTELVDRFFALQTSRKGDLWLLRGRCYEQEFIPFKGLDAIVDSLANHLRGYDEAELSALLPARLQAVTALFPALYRVPAIARVVPPPASQDTQIEQREAGFVELGQLVTVLSRERLLVFILDDLQWAGADSEALLEALFGGAHPPPVLLLATRRSSEAPVLSLFRRLPVARLSSAESTELVRALWPEMMAQQTPSELRAFVAETGGHPLFLQEMTRYASQGGVVRSDLRLDRVLRERVLALPGEARALLELSAIAGVPLPERVLARALNISRVDCASALRRLAAEQLMRTGGVADTRTFEPYHDRIREAIVEGLASGEYSLSRGASVAQVHLALGRQLLRARDEQTFEVQPSTLAHHYNLSVSAFDSLDDVRAALELNLGALRQVRMATAVEAAEHYLRRARALVHRLAAVEQRGFRRRLAFEEMELAHLVHDAPRMKSLFLGLVEDSRSDSELADAYERKVVLLTARSKHVEAIAIARACLAELGAPMEASGSQLDLLRDVLKLELAIRGREPATLTELPELRDERARAQMRILMSITPPLYFTDATLMCTAMVRIAQISLRAGLTDFSAYGFAGYAMVLAGAFRMYERAFEFSQLSLSLNQRFVNHALDTKLPFICGIFIAPYQRPFDEAHAYLTRALARALPIGDLNFMAYSAVSLPMVTLCAGKPLAQAGAESERAERDADRVAAVDMSFVARWQVRMVRCLEGARPSPLIMDASEGSELVLREQTLGHHPMASFYYALNKAVLGYHFGELASAQYWIEQAVEFSSAQFGLLSTVDLTLYRALISCAALERARLLRERARLRIRIASSAVSLRIWARNQPENFGAHDQLIRAERARVMGSAAQAEQGFVRALREAERHGNWRVAAIAWERLSQCHAAVGAIEESARCRRGAAAAYGAWGAHAKVRELAR